MRRVCLFFAFVLVVTSWGLLASVTGGTVGARSATGFTFQDPVGDAGAAPDISTGSVSTDRPTGSIVISMLVNGLSVPRSGASSISLKLATSKEFSTVFRPLLMITVTLNVVNNSGPPADYPIVKRWQGASWAVVPASPSMSFSRDGDHVTWSLGRGDVGADPMLLIIAGTSGDRAPDTGFWRYDIESGTVPTAAVPTRLVIDAVSPSPARPVRGKRFSVRFRFDSITAGGSRGPFVDGTFVCDPSIGGVVIAHRETLSRGVVSVSLLVPKRLGSRVLRIKLTVRADGNRNVTTTKAVAFPIASG